MALYPCKIEGCDVKNFYYDSLCSFHEPAPSAESIKLDKVSESLDRIGDILEAILEDMRRTRR